VMWDYEYLREMSKGISGVIKYGTCGDEHVSGMVFKNDPLLEVEILQGLDEKYIRTGLIGEYNLPNVLAAVTIGKYFKVPEKKIHQAIENYVPSNSRSQLIEKGSNKIILDAYNANPSSLRLAIENFSKIPSENKVLVLGAMAELGSDSLEEHASIVSLIEKYTWKEVALVGGDFMKVKHSFHSFPSAAEAREWLQKNNFKNAYLLVKGSRSMQMEKVLD